MSGRIYSLAEVADATGATPRQLQWWDERGILCPKRGKSGSGRGRGDARLYAEADLTRALRIMEVRAGSTFNIKTPLGKYILNYPGPGRFLKRPEIIAGELVIPYRGASRGRITKLLPRSLGLPKGAK